MESAAPARPPIPADISDADLIARYLAGPALVRDTIAGMTPEQLNARPIDGKMSSHQVVTHIVDSDRALGGRIRSALAGIEPVALTGAHPEAVDDPTRDLDAELVELSAARELMAGELSSASEEQWSLAAMRWAEREMTVRQVLGMMTRHLESHVAAIEEKRTALGL